MNKHFVCLDPCLSVLQAHTCTLNCVICVDMSKTYFTKKKKQPPSWNHIQAICAHSLCITRHDSSPHDVLYLCTG